MKIIEVFRSKIVIFLIQILILSLFIYYVDYEFTINFDSNILRERAIIIKFLANFVLFNDFSGLFFIYSIWIIVSFVPILIYWDFKRAYSMNLITYFFPNFFLYTFLHHYYRNYFKANFRIMFTNTFILGIIILIISIEFSLILQNIRSYKKKAFRIDLKQIIRENSTFCPNCGTKFDSIPQFCYNCNTKIVKKDEDSRREDGE